MPASRAVIEARLIRSDGEKQCIKCGQSKSRSQFTISRRHADGRLNTCKECKNGPNGEYQQNRTTRIQNAQTYYSNNKEIISKNNQVRKYGVSSSWLEERYSIQKSLCEICKRDGGIKKSLCIDHDHQTGEVRGLICGKCNTAIGMVEESTEILMAIIEYLERYKDVIRS